MTGVFYNLGLPLRCAPGRALQGYAVRSKVLGAQIVHLRASVSAIEIAFTALPIPQSRRKTENSTPSHGNFFAEFLF